MSKNLINKLNTTLLSGELFQFVEDSLANKQVLQKLGFSSKGQYVKIVREYLESYDIDISHFTTNGLPKVSKIEKKCICCGKVFHTEKREDKEQVTCSRSCSNTIFRSGKDHWNYSGIHPEPYRPLAIKTYGYKCQRCGYAENKAAIIVHHKDHNRENNNLDNLEILCANCHAIHHWG